MSRRMDVQSAELTALVRAVRKLLRVPQEVRLAAPVPALREHATAVRRTRARDTRGAFPRADGRGPCGAR